MWLITQLRGGGGGGGGRGYSHLVTQVCNSVPSVDSGAIYIYMQGMCCVTNGPVGTVRHVWPRSVSFSSRWRLLYQYSHVRLYMLYLDWLCNPTLVPGWQQGVLSPLELMVWTQGVLGLHPEWDLPGLSDRIL